MTDYGVLDSGFVAKKVEDIKQDFVNNIKGKYPDASLASQTIEGDFIDAVSDIAALLWEVLEASWYSSSVVHAKKISQDNLFAINNVQRYGARKSKAPNVTITGTIGTIIPAGYIAKVTGNNTYVWKTTQTAVIDSSGSVKVDFFCDTAGAIDLATSTLDLPVTVVTGVSSIENTFATVLGREVETDTEFLVRRNNQIANSIGGSEQGIYNAIIDLNTDEDTRIIDFVKIISNRTSSIDAAGREPHSIECVVSDAASTVIINSSGSITNGTTTLTAPVDLTSQIAISDIIQLSSDVTLFQAERFTVRNIVFSAGVTTITLNSPYQGTTASSNCEISTVEGKDQEIAETILRTTSGGIGLEGIACIDVVDESGDPQVVKFNYPAPKNISVELTLSVTSALTTEEEIDLKNTIATWGNSLGIGKNVVVYGFNCLVGQLNNAKIIDVDPINMGYENSLGVVVWVGDVNITINDGLGASGVEYSHWSASNITLL